MPALVEENQQEPATGTSGAVDDATTGRSDRHIHHGALSVVLRVRGVPSMRREMINDPARYDDHNELLDDDLHEYGRTLPLVALDVKTSSLDPVVGPMFRGRRRTSIMLPTGYNVIQPMVNNCKTSRAKVLSGRTLCIRLCKKACRRVGGWR